MYEGEETVSGQVYQIFVAKNIFHLRRTHSCVRAGGKEVVCFNRSKMARINRFLIMSLWQKKIKACRSDLRRNEANHGESFVRKTPQKAFKSLKVYKSSICWFF